VPGAIHRRVELGALHVRGRRLELRVRNEGNVDERLGRNVLVADVWRGGRRLARLQPRARDLLPHARGVVEFRLPRSLRGRVRIVARISLPPVGRRSFMVAV
jgi:hypothetical protein